MLAAGGSRRLGRPKQLLPYGDGTLLGHVRRHRARVRASTSSSCALGGAADEVRASVDLSGAEVVVNDAYGEGCSSSIAAALGAVDPRCDVLVLMLGDQPGVDAGDGARRCSPAAATRRWRSAATTTGAGTRSRSRAACSATLAALHGDKAVWRLLDRRAADVAEVPVAGPVPLDVDTREDYEAVLAAA